MTWWWTFLQISCCLLLLPGILVFLLFLVKRKMHQYFCLCISSFHFWLRSEYKTRRWKINLAQVLYFIILAWVKETSPCPSPSNIWDIWKLMIVCFFIKAFFLYQTFSYFHKEHLKALEKELDNFCYGREHVEQSSSFSFDNFVNSLFCSIRTPNRNLNLVLSSI